MIIKRNKINRTCVKCGREFGNNKFLEKTKLPCKRTNISKTDTYTSYGVYGLCTTCKEIYENLIFEHFCEIDESSESIIETVPKN